MPPEDDRYCFACGEKNPIGLHLAFTYDEEGVEAQFTPQRVHQGYNGLMHGGLVATLMDETMAHAVSSSYGPAVTGDLHIRLRGGGVPTGQTVRLLGRVIGRRGRLILAEAEILDEEGATLAKAEAKFMLRS
jgi:acyl-coenzyme A thioesterase PaaI-like protein